jgi:hypothetical protein
MALTKAKIARMTHKQKVAYLLNWIKNIPVDDLTDRESKNVIKFLDFVIAKCEQVIRDAKVHGQVK